MKLGQKYKIEKPKTEEELVLSAEGLTDIMFGDKVNQEGLWQAFKDALKKEWEGLKEGVDKWKHRNDPKTYTEERLTQAGKDKLKKELLSKQKQIVDYLKKNKLVKDIDPVKINFTPVNYKKDQYDEYNEMWTMYKLDMNYVPDEFIFLVGYLDIIQHDEDENWDPTDFYTDIRHEGFEFDEEAETSSGMIGITIKKDFFVKDKDYFIYNSGGSVNQEGILDTIKGWFGKKQEKPEEIVYTLGKRAKIGLLDKKDFSKAYCFPTNNLFPYVYNYLFKNPADVKKYVMGIADNFNRLIALTGKPGVVDPVKVSKALKDVNQFLNPRIVRKSTSDNIIYGLSDTFIDIKEKAFHINTAAMSIDMRNGIDGKYPIVYLDTEYAQQIDRLEMELSPSWLAPYSNYLDPSVIKVLINDYKQYKETYLKLDKKIPMETRRGFTYTLPEVYSATDQTDDIMWNETLVNAMGQMVDAVEFIEDMVDAIAELSIVDDNLVQELISEYNLKKA